jgi:hypothetical protein
LLQPALLFRRASENRQPIQNRVPEHALIASIQISAQLLEVASNDMTAANERIRATAFVGSCVS